MEENLDEILELIKVLKEFPDENLTEATVDFIADGLKGRFAELVTPENVESMYHEMVVHGYTKATAKMHRDVVKSNMDGLMAEANFSNVYKNQILQAVFGNILDIIDRAIEMYGNYVAGIGFESVHPEAKLPTYAHEDDACCDVYSPADITIPAHATGFKVSTGLKAAIPDDYEIQVRPRSGMSMKTPLRISNTPGTVDSSYTGEIGVLFDNLSDEDYTIHAGDRIAQFALKPVYRFRAKFIDSVESVKTTARKEGGFGSSGV